MVFLFFFFLLFTHSGTGDCWSRLASLINNLEKFQEHYKLFLNDPDENDPSKKINEMHWCFVFTLTRVIQFTFF